MPLHNSLPWLEVIKGNLNRLSTACQVVVSDATEADATLHLLREQFDRRATNPLFIGHRAIAEGWIAHYNDLLQKVQTPFFMWLPHDNEIDLSYVVQCRTHLVNMPDIGAALGQIDSVAAAGLNECPQPPLPNKEHLQRYAFQSNELMIERNLGVLFRAVFRTSLARPVPMTYNGDN